MGELGEVSPRRFLAFVEAKVEAVDGVPGTRTGLVLDCVEADAYREDRGGEPKALAIVRVLSTPKRLKALFDLPRMPVEGDWLQIDVADGEGLPLAWVLSAEAGYRGPVQRLRLHDMRFLRTEADPTPGPAGDDLAPETSETLVMHFTLAGPPSDSDMRAGIEAVLTASKGKGGLHARMLDVGQASAIAIHTARHPDAEVLGFFDVGWPLWFHFRSLPKATSVKLPAADGFVFLSHWDFDHFAMAIFHRPELKALRWYAPRQSVGPNTANFARSLGDRLTYLEDDSYGPPEFQLVRGRGADLGVPNDRNATGYVLRFDGEDGARLLTGDVSYEFIPAAIKSGLMGVAIPHHAGPSTEPPPTPVGDTPVAVASYGMPNRYRHPSNPVIEAHVDAGWCVRVTAATSILPRSDRWV